MLKQPGWIPETTTAGFAKSMGFIIVLGLLGCGVLSAGACFPMGQRMVEAD